MVSSHYFNTVRVMVMIYSTGLLTACTHASLITGLNGKNKKQSSLSKIHTTKSTGFKLKRNRDTKV